MSEIAPTTALCVVPFELFDEVRSTYESFDWGSAEAYYRAVEAHLGEIVGEGRRAEVAVFEPEEYTEWCAREGLGPDGSAARAAWAEVARRVPYRGSLADALTHHHFVSLVQRGLAGASDGAIDRVEEALGRLRAEVSGLLGGPALATVLAFDAPLGAPLDERRPYLWSFLAEGDDEGSLRAARPTEEPLLVTLVTLGLLHGGRLEIEPVLDAGGRVDRPSHELGRWTLGPDLVEMFTRTAAQP